MSLNETIKEIMDIVEVNTEEFVKETKSIIDEELKKYKKALALATDIIKRMQKKILLQSQTIKTLNEQVEQLEQERVVTYLRTIINFEEELVGGEWYWIDCSEYLGWAMADFSIDENGKEHIKFKTLENIITFEVVSRLGGTVYRQFLGHDYE